METQPSEGSRTVPAGLDTLRVLPWDLLWELLFPSGSLVLTPRGPQGPGEHPLVLAWTRAEQTTSREPSPALPTPDPLSRSLLPLLLSLSQGVAEVRAGRGLPARSSACCGPQVPTAGPCWKDIPRASGSANHSPTHHGDQPSSEGTGHSSHILTRLPSHCGSTHRTQAGPFICRERAPCPQESSLIPPVPPFQDGIHTSLRGQQDWEPSCAHTG